MRRFTGGRGHDAVAAMTVPVSTLARCRRRHGVLAVLALLLVLTSALWPLAQARLVAQGGPLTRILCSGFARAPLSADARASLQRLADLTGDDSLRPVRQTPACPCQGCFLHGHSLAPVLPEGVKMPVRLVRIAFVSRLPRKDSLPVQHGPFILSVRAPPPAAVFA